MATSADLSRSNLFSQSYTNVFNLLNNRTNVIDPLDASGSRKLVYAREPEVNDRGFDGYPLIIVQPISVTRDNTVLDGKRAVLIWDVDVWVRSSDHSTQKGAKTGLGMEYLDQLSDSILATLNNVSNRATLRNYGMSNLTIRDSPVTIDFTENERVFNREFTISFRKLVSVSA